MVIVQSRARLNNFLYVSKVMNNFSCLNNISWYKSLVSCVANVTSLYYYITKQDAWCQENNLSFIWSSRNVGYIFDHDEPKLNSTDERHNTNFININLQNLRPSGRLLNRTDVCRTCQNIFVIVVGNGALQTWLSNKYQENSSNFLRIPYLDF